MRAGARPSTVPVAQRTFHDIQAETARRTGCGSVGNFFRRQSIGQNQIDQAQARRPDRAATAPPPRQIIPEKAVQPLTPEIEQSLKPKDSFKQCDRPNGRAPATTCRSVRPGAFVSSGRWPSRHEADRRAIAIRSSRQNVSRMPVRPPQKHRDPRPTLASYAIVSHALLDSRHRGFRPCENQSPQQPRSTPSPLPPQVNRAGEFRAAGCGRRA